MRRPALSLALVLAGSLGAACDVFDSDVPDLGDPYRVESRPEPLLDGDRLIVTVSYSGGCRDHAFTLGSAQVGDDPTLWLTHDANGDTCEALVSESLEVPVPTAALRGRPVYLWTSETERIPLQESLR